MLKLLAFQQKSKVFVKSFRQEVVDSIVIIPQRMVVWRFTFVSLVFNLDKTWLIIPVLGDIQDTLHTVDRSDMELLLVLSK